MQLDHIFVRLDLDRWTLTCRFTMEVICRNATPPRLSRPWIATGALGTRDRILRPFSS